MTKTYTTIQQVQAGVDRIVERMREKGFHNPVCAAGFHSQEGFAVAMGDHMQDWRKIINSTSLSDAFRDAHIWVGNLPLPDPGNTDVPA